MTRLALIKWRENNREHYLELSRAYSKKRRMKPEVKEYQKNYLKKWKETNKDKIRGYQIKSFNKHRVKNYANSRQWAKNLWNEYLDHYGKLCACCGEQEIRFLTIEHLNGDGHLHRKQIKCRSKAMQILDIKRRGWPSEYTVLCFNCNCAKDKNGDICPHEDARKRVFNVIAA